MRWLLAMLCALSFPSAAWAENYYVDSAHGDDGHDGLRPDTAWRTLAKVNGFPLKPGDTVLLIAGSVWREPLVVGRSGTATARITIGRSGEGTRPRIDAGGVADTAVSIANAEYVSVSGIEITNDGPPGPARIGVLVAAEDFGVARDIRVTDLYIHDVRGSNDRKDNGGIVFRAIGPKIASRFEGLDIERNILWRVDRSGIAGISDQITRARWFPSRYVVIRDNVLEDIGGDGIVPRGADGTLIEHNIVRHAAQRADGYSVAIWQWSTDNSLIQLNEAAFTHGRYDGQGFDSDFNSRGTTIAFNYSHDNDGGFLLVCTPGQRNDGDNLGNLGTVVRGNVSRNDGARIFQIAGDVQGATIEGNVVHVPAGQDVQMAIMTQWLGWARDVRFMGNWLGVAGTARYGHEAGRKGPDYLLGPGFPPAQAIAFSGNRYYGRHVDPPDDPGGERREDWHDKKADWSVPVFDPAQPDGLTDFLARHRAWMLKMLGRELGRGPAMLTAQPMPAAQWRR